MADDTDTTHPGEAEARRAAWTVQPVDKPLKWEDIALLVSAIYPVIEAAVRRDEHKRPRSDVTEAIETDMHAALEAMFGSEGATDILGDYCNAIAAAVREQAAQDIEAMDEPYWDTDGAEVGWSWAQDAAARVARGGR